MEKKGARDASQTTHNVECANERERVLPPVTTPYSTRIPTPGFLPTPHSSAPKLYTMASAKVFVGAFRLHAPSISSLVNVASLCLAR